MKIHTITGGDGLNLHVREWGKPDGATILLIHGWSQNHLSWQRQFESELATEFRLVALDIRGHGMSEAPMPLECYADSRLWADDISAIIATLGLDRPVLAGWSYGGLVIADYIRVHGQNAVSGINFIGAPPALNERVFGTFIGPVFPENFEDATAGDMPKNIEAMKRFLHACFEIPIAQSDFETALAYNVLVTPQVRLNLGSRDLDNTDIMEQLKLPVLVSQGRQDNVVLPAAADHIIEHCATAEASWYDGVGHAPFLEDPERFNRELADFTRRCQQ